MDSAQVDPKPVEATGTMETEIVKKEVVPNAGRCGIFNIGNTCYMSTGIQVGMAMTSDRVVSLSHSGLGQAADHGRVRFHGDRGDVWMMRS